MKYRIEHDSVGDKQVPVEAYYGVQSLRGAENFKISGKTLHPAMVKNLAIVKKACAIVNNKCGIMSDDVCKSIVYACDEILAGKYQEEFLTDMVQGGAGTSANMNANEVIANIANEHLGGGLGTYEHVHPNDHVNMGQSTNDVYPSAGKLGALDLIQDAIKELNRLYNALMNKSDEFSTILKMGRTQLQDAVPMTLGQEFHAYASVIRRDINRIEHASHAIKVINMGGSAIGTGINVDRNYFDMIVPEISKLTGYDLEQAPDLIDGTHNLDGLVELSSALKTCAVNLSKISNDLRLMGSGPKTMIADIILPPKQNGSSIMPGKVNPVIPEVVNQVAFKVIGNDVTISMCAEGGQLELNAFEPVLFYSLYESIEFITHGVETLIDNCIVDIKPNLEVLKKDLETSVGTITAFVPHIGYQVSADIAKESLRTGTPIRKLILDRNLLTEDEINEIFDPQAMTKPGIAAEYLIKQKQNKDK